MKRYDIEALESSGHPWLDVSMDKNGKWVKFEDVERAGKILFERSKKIELLEKYSMYLEKHGYMDIDWRTEEPYAIDDYFIEQRDKLLK